jgi:hypothetical protein
VRALGPSRIFPAHGPVIDRPERLLRNYIEHRRERDAQILDALRLGDRTAEAIVARLYARLDAAVVPRALQTVTAHLQKLEGEARVRRAGESWHIIGP